MSSENKNGGGCFGLLLVVVGVVVGLIATKPDEAAHKAAFAKRTPVTRAMFGVGEMLGHAELKYHDYIIFSVMTTKYDRTSSEMPITFGFLGKVYYGKDK